MTKKQSPSRPHLGAVLLISAGTLVVFTLVSTVVGNHLSSAYIRGDFIPWTQVESPPGNPIHLRIGGNGEVLLEMVHGNLLEWDRSKEPPWVEVQTPSGIAPYWCDCYSAQDNFYRPPAPPREPLEQVEATCLCADVGTHYKFVLLDNGEIWKWEHGTGQGYLEVVPRTFFAVCLTSLVLSISVFALLFFVLRWPRARTK